MEGDATAIATCNGNWRLRCRKGLTADLRGAMPTGGDLESRRISSVSDNMRALEGRMFRYYEQGGDH